VRRLLVLACLACALTGAPGAAALTVGVSDDAGKYSRDGGASFFSSLHDLGGSENAIVVWFDAEHPTTIAEQPLLDASIARAQLEGVRVVLDIYVRHAHDLSGNPAAVGQYAAFLQQLARRYPGVHDYIVGNEPNQPRFWQPQFDGRGNPVSPAAYVRSLAAGYDALKAVDPGIRVLGFALSERGNDNWKAPNNVSMSPLRFLARAGQAYRASARAKPLMDAFAYHPYPRNPLDPIARGLGWPNAGVKDLDRVKQAVWDAFHGTAQPTFESGLELAITEIGWQVSIPRSSIAAYTGQENKTTTEEKTQAAIYGEVLRQLSCDPVASDLLFFHLVDETQLAGWQSGLIRADGTKRASYFTVQKALSAGGGRCPGTPTSWRHATGVVGFSARFPQGVTNAKTAASWSLTVNADEGASFVAGLVRVDGTPTVETVTASLASRAKVALRAAGRLKIGTQTAIAFPLRPVPPGRYVYAVRAVGELAPERASVAFSAPFTLR